jgi:outer membrane lipoprotein SlyB
MGALGAIGGAVVGGVLGLITCIACLPGPWARGSNQSFERDAGYFLFFVIIGAILGGMAGKNAEDSEFQTRRRDEIHRHVEAELNSILHKHKEDSDDN